MFKTKFGVRNRILAIAMVPCAALLGGGAATSLYVTSQGLHARRWSATVQDSVQPSITYFAALEEERRLTLWKLAGRLSNPTELAAQRGRVDAVLQTGPIAATFASLDPATVRRGQTAMTALVHQLPMVRQRVDADAISADDVDSYYSQIIGVGVINSTVIARTAPNARTAVDESTVTAVVFAGEAFSRSAGLRRCLTWWGVSCSR